MSSFKSTLSVVVAALLILADARSAGAAYRLCAFRDGPSGACTCKADQGGPGEFKTVPARYCKVAKRAKPAPTATAATVAAPESSQGAAVKAEDEQTLTTGATPADTAAATSPGTSIPPQSKKLAEIKSRGKILCGVNTGLLGFSSQTQSGEWSGLDADFCRAVAAAALGDAKKVEFIPLQTGERFEALRSGKVDLLSRNTTWTMQRDIEEQVAFAGVLFFDGQGFLTAEDRGLVSAQQLAGSNVCVEQATTSETNVEYYFKHHKINVTSKVFSSHAELVKAYQSGECDVYSGDRSSLFADRASFADPNAHAILPEVISKEPLGPAVAKGDEGWAAVVRWTLAALINAEEVGLDKSTAANSAPLAGDARRLVEGAGSIGEKLGLSNLWVRDVVAGVGNYQDVFESNVGKQSPLGMERGINALWKRGGLLYAAPMW